MIRKNEELTGAKLKKEKKRFKKAAPIYEKKNLTKLELFASNICSALVDTVQTTDMNKEHIEMLLYLYQFEYFEKQWVYENYKAMFTNKIIYGERRAANTLGWLKRNEYVQFYKHTKIKYEEWEQRGDRWTGQEIISGDKYKLSNKGLEVIKEYFENLTKEPPAKVDRRKKRLIWRTQLIEDFNNYLEF